MQAYIDFLKSKIDIVQETGFEVPMEEFNPVMKPHQSLADWWALKGGRRAIFAAFGLGKTVMELEWARIVMKYKGGRALIVLPLGVKLEFQRDACQLLGMEEPQYVRTNAEAAAARGDILLTNYERVRDGDIDPAQFTAVSLDEAAVLRSLGTKTCQVFLRLFRGIPYKLVCTAVPDPNSYIELIHYAEFLEVAAAGQVLTRFFKRDSSHAHNATLFENKEDEFWLWVSSWALFINLPSDLGFSDEGYVLPPMDIRYHEVPVDHSTAGTDKFGQGKLIRDAALSLQDAAREKRDSIAQRVAVMKEIVEGDPAAHFLLWHDLEAERHAIKAALPEAVDIWGNLDLEERERRVIDFQEGRTRLFATKKDLSAEGGNYQRFCHRAVFAGIDYDFHDFIQAIHRIYRFLQTETVIIDIIYTESERQILQALLRKWDRFRAMQEKMRGIIKKYGLSTVSLEQKLTRSIGVERKEVRGRHFTAIRNDCILETADMPENSVGLIVTSIPFGNQFEYSESYNDLGHNEDTVKFFEQMDFLTPNLLRVLQPGRVMCVHVKDRMLYGSVTGDGMYTMEPFHADCISHYRKHGFLLMGMITVVTDVVRENSQTYRLGYSEQCKDGTKMGVGASEYVLLFRKRPSDTSTAYADVPVAKSKEEYTRARWQLDAHGLYRTSGNRLITTEELLRLPADKLQKIYRKYSRETVYDYEAHVRIAEELDRKHRLPTSYMVVAPGSWDGDVWDDITRIRTLNTKQSQRRLQMHVCPLPIDIVERLVRRYSNKGDVVYDPFAGLFTVPEVAVRLEREGLGCELADLYFNDGVSYLREADAGRDVFTLFDLLEEMEA